MLQKQYGYVNLLVRAPSFLCVNNELNQAHIGYLIISHIEAIKTYPVENWFSYAWMTDAKGDTVLKPDACNPKDSFKPPHSSWPRMAQLSENINSSNNKQLVKILNYILYLFDVL